MPPHASQPPAPALTPLPDLLARVSAELADIAAATNRLHTLAAARTGDATGAGAGDGTGDGDGTGYGNATAGDHAYLQALQSVDHIEQKLRGIAGFLADLAQAAKPDWQIDAQTALAAITLADLAARLKGQPPHPEPAAAAGDYELF